MNPGGSSETLLSCDECVAGEDNVGYRLLKLEKIDMGLGELCVCKHCHSTLKLVGNRKGLVSRINIVCSNTACKKSILLSDPSSSEDTKINDAAILGTRMAGCGHGAMQELSACLGMLPPLSRPMWTKHNKAISATSTVVARNCRLEAARHLHEKKGKPPNEIIDVIVTVDGTWQKRGVLHYLVL